ncbi:hypothetical protein NDI76_16090 [Halogeometricum sp. S1BR25-6]|uniref:Collagen-binding domain-containing protein n=1 Tax=Halogeometricum salsisoli TaxID=2950536 RepID=A0ABU2GHJ0_9EURY|nr:hypothetical protein [Halogeometricum sp. S1BR25-6]MDS0300267.1 hypothetical protein [Halogeometricum sp. S1BR25-6]
MTVIVVTTAMSNERTPSRDPITVSEENPWYFEYRGEPILLVGGFEEDNPFQWTEAELTDALDRLEASGGNFLRNVLSYRDEGNVPPFATVEDGTYDLEELNEEFEDRLFTFLEESRKRDLIVQITFWDQFDHYGRWSDVPWNPENNVNYSPEESGLPEEYDAEEGEVSVFYDSVAEGNDLLLSYQEQFIEAILDLTRPYGHVIYNINNESRTASSWERHWLEFVRSYAGEQESTGDHATGVRDAPVTVTAMRINPGESVSRALGNPDRYSHVEISQNNQNAEGAVGQQHWDNIQSWRAELYSHDAVRPLSNEKIYGGLEAEQGDHQKWAAGTTDEAIARFWRNIIGGCATARFHRSEDGWGLGLRAIVQRQLEAVRMLLSETDLMEATPSNSLLRERETEHLECAREDDEAYCAANRNAGEYIVYFLSGGRVPFDAADTSGSVTIRWLDIEHSEWAKASNPTVEHDQIELETPSEDGWIAVIREE